MGAVAMFISRYWKQILIVSIILFVLIYIYKRGKARGESGKPKVIDIPKSYIDPKDPNNLLIDGAKVRRIATELHDDMEGINFGHDDEIYKEYAALNDAEFIAVYNDFNARYFNEEEETLKEWIVGETFGGWTIIYDVILPRMARENLN